MRIGVSRSIREGPLQGWVREERQLGTPLCSGVEFWKASPVLQAFMMVYLLTPGDETFSCDRLWKSSSCLRLRF